LLFFDIKEKSCYFAPDNSLDLSFKKKTK